MPDHVLTCRIYFSDQGNADNAYQHLVALAEHSAAHDRHIDGQPDTSWIRLHDCYANEDNGDTTRCETTARHVLNEQQQGDQATLWAPGQTITVGDLREYDGTVYEAVQAHTTQQGWEPPAAPALWTEA